MKAEEQLSYMVSKERHSIKVDNYLSGEQLREKLQRSARATTPKVEVTPPRKEQGAQVEKAHEMTTDTRASVSELLSQLKDFDEQRSDIKYLVYSEDPYCLDALYQRWGQLHSQMKETLEAYIEAVGHGKSLPQIFLQAEAERGKRIDGLSAETVYSSLDMFLQSLYLDERELMLYRNNQERAASIRSCPQRRLIFE